MCRHPWGKASAFPRRPEGVRRTRCLSGHPFAGAGSAGTLPEIYAYGVRNPQRFGWDAATGNMYLADIGQNIVEEIRLVTRGANLGWNDWEGSDRFISRQEVSLVDSCSGRSRVRSGGCSDPPGRV